MRQRKQAPGNFKVGGGEICVGCKSLLFDVEPQRAKEYPALQEMWEEITGGGNLIFVMDDEDAQDDEEIRRAWKEFLDSESSGREGICMVTGKKDRDCPDSFYD